MESSMEYQEFFSPLIVNCKAEKVNAPLVVYYVESVQRSRKQTCYWRQFTDRYSLAMPGQRQHVGGVRIGNATGYFCCETHYACLDTSLWFDYTEDPKTSSQAEEPVERGGLGGLYTNKQQTGNQDLSRAMGQ